MIYVAKILKVLLLKGLDYNVYLVRCDFGNIVILK